MPIKVLIRETLSTQTKGTQTPSQPSFYCGMTWFNDKPYVRIPQRLHFLEMFSRMNVMQELIPAKGKLSVLIQGGMLTMFGEIEVAKSKDEGYLKLFEDLYDELEVLAERYAKACPKGETSLILDYGYIVPHA